MQSFVIDEKSNKKSVISVIQKHYPHLAYQTLSKAFRQKDIKLNGKWVDKNDVVAIGDNVQVYIRDDLLTTSYGVCVYYEDTNVVVVYKPRGIESCGNKANVEYLDDIVKERICKQSKICHRLDTNTEGLVIFAKNDKAYEQILQCFKEERIQKEYIALVYGKMVKKHEILQGYLLKDIDTSYCKVVDKPQNNACSIKTEYNVKEYISTKDVSIIQIILHTGKTHQIRAHMKHIGHAIVGDSKYAPNELNRKMGLRYQVLYATKYIFNFGQDTKLYYLNDIQMDITEKIISQIKEKL